MNTGKTIQELAVMLDARANAKHDVVVDAKDIIMRPNGSLKLEVVGDGVYDINDVAHRQIAGITKIPQAYYQRMQDSSPMMVAGNVNHWLEKSDRRHMVRTLGGDAPHARALLSDRYLRIENEQVASAVIPVLSQIDDCVPLATDITDNKMYMKFLFEGNQIDVTGNGDIVKAGVMITNSEVGSGKFMVKGFFYRDFCHNGCVFGSRDMGLEFARTHLGSKLDIGVQTVFSQETVAKNNEAIISSTIDILRYVSSPESKAKMETALRATTQGTQIQTTHIYKAVEVLGKEYGIGKMDQVNVVSNLIDDGDFSRWGVVNAITKLGNDVDFDKANEFETIGSRIIDLAPSQWERKAEAIHAMAA